MKWCWFVLIFFISGCTERGTAIYQECVVGSSGNITFESSMTSKKAEFNFNKVGVSIHSKPIAYAKYYEHIESVTLQSTGNVEMIFKDRSREHFIVLDKACLEKLEVFLKGHGVKTERTAHSEYSVDSSSAPK